MCAPGLHARIQEYSSGGRGPVQSDKKALTFFFFFFFFSPQLILQKSNGQFQRNLSFLKVLEGVQLFPGGSNCLFPIETLITCDFPGGGPDPLPPPPLWIRTWPKCKYVCFTRPYLPTKTHPTKEILLPYLAVIFLVWEAKTNSMQTDVNVYLNVFQELEVNNLSVMTRLFFIRL